MKHRNVSIIMCTYNGEKFLREQLDSIINQSYPIYELIVQDDRSTDDTTKIIEEYAKQHAFIRLHVNQQNLGYNRNFLSAILQAKGDAIAIADQDDVWEKEKIEKQLNKLNEGYSLVFHNSLLFEESTSNIVSQRHRVIPVVTELRLILKPFIPGHECCFTKDALPLIAKLYHMEHHLAYAYVIAIACSTLGKLAYLNEGLVYWRRHAAAATRKDNEKNHGAIEGLFGSLSSLLKPKQREIPTRYFKVIDTLSFQTVVAQKVTKLMQGNIIQILMACMICGYHTAAFFNKTTGRNFIKATFTPLHLIREGSFLIK